MQHSGPHPLHGSSTADLAMTLDLSPAFISNVPSSTRLPHPTLMSIALNLAHSILSTSISASIPISAPTMVEPLEDYWFPISMLGDAFRLEDGHYVMQDWDQKQECLKQ
ncbi:hypothetical protein BD413DRAFT_207809 [Trametes elegans]|nr:hypothetical protein BD413DRAFT_300262 [Trametes elegans]KAI0763417.1 hypothetical protein BD413DRAFT_207809 [Trametes elegans]